MPLWEEAERDGKHPGVFPIFPTNLMGYPGNLELHPIRSWIPSALPQSTLTHSDSAPQVLKEMIWRTARVSWNVDNDPFGWYTSVEAHRDIATAFLQRCCSFLRVFAGFLQILLLPL